MKRKLLFITIASLALAFTASACSRNIPQTGGSGADFLATQQAFIEQAAQATANSVAVSTQIAQLQTQVAQAGQPQKTAVSAETAPTAVPATATAVPPTATATQLPPTATTVPPTATLLPPTATRVPPTPTATAIPCNLAQFMGDVTIPDGTVLSPNAIFTKTWRLKNTGACTWTTAYDVVFASGSALTSTTAVSLPGNVAPGQVVDVSVKMTAPSSEGHYRGYWKLRDPSGVLFGTGAGGATFYVDIRVSAPASVYPLDFIASMCAASWSSGAGTLDCPGLNNDASGFVLRVDNPRLESGYQDDEPVLVTYPQMISGGTIQGIYPAYHVHTGDHFRSIVGCGYQTDGCDVQMELKYQIGNGAVQTLKSWHERYEGKTVSVDVDLSSLVDKDVKFILSATANASSSHNRAQWLLPRIER